MPNYRITNRQGLVDSYSAMMRAEQITTIGDRISRTGLYDAQSADGGIVEGRKIYNAQSNGEAVLVEKAEGQLPSLSYRNSTVQSGRVLPEIGALPSEPNKDLWGKPRPKRKEDEPQIWTLQGNAQVIAPREYRLTTNLNYQVGAIGCPRPNQTPNLTFSCEYRMYGQRGIYFGDGFSVAYVPSLLGNNGEFIGVGDIGNGWAVQIDTFNNNDYPGTNYQYPIIRILYPGGYWESGQITSLHTSTWGALKIKVRGNVLHINAPGAELEYTVPVSGFPSRYYLRLSASTGGYDDIHEVRKPRIEWDPIIVRS